MIGIIGAMNVEVERLKKLVEDKKTVVISDIEYVSGKIYGKDVVVAKCGVGKVFAAICTQTMILQFKPDIIINSGVAGAVDAQLDVGSIAIGESVVQYDMDTSAVGDPVGLISGINMIHIPCSSGDANAILYLTQSLKINSKKGTIASADRFLNSNEVKSSLRENYKAIACDMESGSIGQVCFVNSVDCVIIRSISDTADGKSAADYREFLEYAAERSSTVTLEFIKNRQK